MKKIFLFGTIAFVSFFSSCKKDRTCTCTYTDSANPQDNESAGLVIHDTKKNAETRCKAYNYSSGTETQICTIK